MSNDNFRMEHKAEIDRLSKEPIIDLSEDEIVRLLRFVYPEKKIETAGDILTMTDKPDQVTVSTDDLRAVCEFTLAQAQQIQDMLGGGDIGLVSRTLMEYTLTATRLLTEIEKGGA